MPSSEKLLIVLDGANIGWMYGNGTLFDPVGIEMALSYFAQFDVDTVTFIPSSYLKKKPRDGSKTNACMETDDFEVLQRLVHTGAVTMVPAGDHDDVYVLSYARAHHGYVVSNDLFQDHISQLEVEAIRNSMVLWLRSHRCGYTFVNGEFLLNPGEG